MCLSTVYKNKMSPEDIVMKNVMRVECKDGCVILTDLMERQVAIEGSCRRPIWWMALSLSGKVFPSKCHCGVTRSSGPHLFR